MSERGRLWHRCPPTPFAVVPRPQCLRRRREALATLHPWLLIHALHLFLTFFFLSSPSSPSVAFRTPLVLGQNIESRHNRTNRLFQLVQLDLSGLPSPSMLLKYAHSLGPLAPVADTFCRPATLHLTGATLETADFTVCGLPCTSRSDRALRLVAVQFRGGWPP